MCAPNWCYVPRVCQKLIIIPVTYIKSNSSPVRTPFKFNIDECDGVKARMHFDDMRSIDKMRVIAKIDTVQTPRAEIEAALKKFMGL